jgi:hypothetical protein
MKALVEVLTEEVMDFGPLVEVLTEEVVDFGPLVEDAVVETTVRPVL